MITCINFLQMPNLFLDLLLTSRSLAGFFPPLLDLWFFISKVEKFLLQVTALQKRIFAGKAKNREMEKYLSVLPGFF